MADLTFGLAVLLITFPLAYRFLKGEARGAACAGRRSAGRDAATAGAKYYEGDSMTEAGGGQRGAHGGAPGRERG
jgi:hypothetical protein